jgi:hypothetical protein
VASSDLIKWGGLTGIVAGVAWAVSGIVHCTGENVRDDPRGYF